MHDLTRIQREVLIFVRQKISSGMPPTHRDIARCFGWTSNAAAKCHLLALEKKGFIKTERKISRGVYLTDAGRELEA